MTVIFKNAPKSDLQHHAERVHPSSALTTSSHVTRRSLWRSTEKRGGKVLSIGIEVSLLGDLNASDAVDKLVPGQRAVHDQWRLP